MKRMIKATYTLATALFVALTLAIAAGQLYANNSASSCDGTGQLGSCAGFGDAICNCACEDEFGTFGFCDANNCCTCAT